MARVLLIRPNDFIADSMVSLVSRAGLEALRVHSPFELQTVELEEVVGAVVSTAVTSSMSMTFAQTIASLRSRSMVPLVATTMLKDQRQATEFVLAELSVLSAEFAPVHSAADSFSHPALGTAHGVLVLRKDEIDAPSPATLALLKRHFGRPT